MSLALQLHSLRRETAGNAETVLRQIPTLGFGAVELAGNYGWSPEKWRELLTMTGLVVVGAHCRLDDIESQMPFHRALGTPRLIISSLPRGVDYRLAARQLNALGLNREFAILFHNHAYEIEDGGLEVLFAETDPGLVQFEVDTYWVEFAGKSARDFLRQHAARVGMIHAKDCRRRDRADVPCGQGGVDFPAIMTMARARNWPVVVEYEGDNALLAVAESARYLSRC